MNKKFQLPIVNLLILIPVIILSGATIKEFPVDQEKQFEKNPTKGIVYLYRPGKAVGAIVKTQIKVNGQDAGGTSNGSYFKWELEPGRYTFSCFSRESSPVVEINVEANEHYFIKQDERLGFTEGGRVTLKQVDENKGVKGVKKCKKKLVSIYQN